VELGRSTAVGEGLARDVGVRVATLESPRLDDLDARSSPRLLCASAEADVERVLPAVSSGRGPLVLVEGPTSGRSERLLEKARVLGYPVAVHSADRSMLLLLHYRHVLDALESTPGACPEPAPEPQELTAELARQTQQLRRVEAQLFSLKSRVEDGARRGAAKAQRGANAPKGRGGDIGALQAKYRKLRPNPRLVFADSQSWLVRDVVGRLYLTVGARGAGSR
jgi:hypothetical protein